MQLSKRELAWEQRKQDKTPKHLQQYLIVFIVLFVYVV